MNIKKTRLYFNRLLLLLLLVTFTAMGYPINKFVQVISYIRAAFIPQTAFLYSFLKLIRQEKNVASYVIDKLQCHHVLKTEY